jgi:hypothetical protein
MNSSGSLTEPMYTEIENVDSFLFFHELIWLTSEVTKLF